MENDETISRLRAAVELNPHDTGSGDRLCMALAARAKVHKQQGLFTAAAADLLEAVAIRPAHAALRNNAGNALVEAGRAAEAEVHLREAVALAPDLPESHFNLGTALNAQEKYEAARAAFEAALRLRPAFFKARTNLGVALLKLERYDEALANYEELARTDPASAEAVNGKGLVLQALGREDEALTYFQRACALKPAFAGAQRNAGLALLMRGDFEAGWPAYAWRWRCEGFDRGWRNFPYPEWQGESGDGTVLLWSEQGIGDDILYAGMIPDLLARGLGVIVETDARLVPLYTRSFPHVTAVAKQDPPDPATQRADIRWHCPMGNLGRWLRPDAGSFPSRSSYIVPDEGRRASYRAYLDARGPGFIVGISWGSGNRKIGRHKTLDLRQWAPLLQMPGVRFVDLQYGDTADERAAVEAELGVHIEHLPDLDLRQDIDGVAALAGACDLVISVSNTTVHLAAAIGRPTWILVPAFTGNLWYWMRGVERVPWYPSATIFRQTKKGVWDEVLAQVAGRLRSEALKRAR